MDEQVGQIRTQMSRLQMPSIQGVRSKSRKACITIGSVYDLITQSRMTFGISMTIRVPTQGLLANTKPSGRRSHNKC